MNNRDYKQFSEGNYYHIYNRGNGKMDIFKDEQDFRNFLKRLGLILSIELPIPTAAIGTRERRKSRVTPLSKGSFSIVCYCLMPNHFHFLVRQNTNISISLLVGKLCSSYGKYFNKKYGHVGTLYQDRIKSVKIDSNRQLLWVSAYIHQNPKVANIVPNLSYYPWSSYGEYLNIVENTLCDKEVIVNQFNSMENYIKFVDESFEMIKKNKDRELFID